jgi:hypothetical protein
MKQLLDFCFYKMKYGGLAIEGGREAVSLILQLQPHQNGSDF